MTYDSTFSPDSARHNHLDQRLGGVLDFDTRNDWNEGQAALTFGSGPDIEWELDGANFLINGSKVGAAGGTVTLSDGEGDDRWRVDHIYASEDGAWQVSEGEPASNEYVYPEIDTDTESVEWHIGENEQAGGPAPKGQDFARRRGELVYSILVPPDATNSDDFGEQHVLDRRREAIDLLQTGRPRQPVINRSFELEPGEWLWTPIVVGPNRTFRLWQYSLSRIDFGLFESDNLELFIIEYTLTDDDDTIEWDVEEEDGPDWHDHSIWDTTDTFDRATNDEEPLFQIDTENFTSGFAFVVENTTDNANYVGVTELGLQVTFTTEDTADL